MKLKHKGIAIIIFLLIPNLVNAATYYVDATAGDDSRTNAQAANPATPWKTISKINSLTPAALPAGSEVYFKCGETWREQLTVPSSGSAGAPIIFTSYGNGAGPKLLSTSVPKNLTGDWTNGGSNLWHTAALVGNPTDVGNLIFNGGTSFGVKKQTKAACIVQGDFYYDDVNHILHIYSVGNPATFYNMDIIVATDTNCITIGYNKKYITIKGLDLRYAGRHGVSCVTGNNNVIVEQNEISYCGGRGTNSYASNGVRLGNGIEFYGNCSNAIARYNYVHHIYDSAISPQTGVGFGGATVSNIYIYGNVIDKSHTGVEIQYQNTGNAVNGIYVYNNTITNSGHEGFGYEPTPNGHALMIHELFLANSTYSNIVLKNNICYESSGHGDLIWIDNIMNSDASPFFAITLDNNCYYRASGKYATLDGVSYATFAAYQAATATDESHSIGTNPQLAEPANGKFWCLPGSPCINAGDSTLGPPYNYGLHLNSSWPSAVKTFLRSGVWDIGAYENEKGVLSRPSGLNVGPVQE